jgi:PPOX class probable F420-dependent enzyme
MPKLQPNEPLPSSVVDFIAPPRFATIATVDPDGAPRTAVIWYLLRDGAVLVNSARGRRWPANAERTGRIALAIPDAANGLRWIGLAGRVEVDDDPERALADISAMAHRYSADDPAEAERDIARFRTHVRVTFRLLPDEYHLHLD